jgi:hypothetical protein
VDAVVIIAMARLRMNRIDRVRGGIQMGLSGLRIAGRLFSVRWGFGEIFALSFAFVPMRLKTPTTTIMLSML